MITLITATPGGGKTAFVVSEFILKEQEKAKREGREPRKVYVYNIPALKLPHEPLPALEQWTETTTSELDASLTSSRFALDHGALVVIDEAQEIYRVRASGSKVPPHVSAFERHRHQGLDFVLITQEPALIDSHVRKLVGRHVHIRATGLGRKQYEWPNCVESPDAKYKSAPVQVRWKLPKHVFGLYKSATIHVKPVRRVPTAVYWLASIAVLFGVTVTYIYNMLAEKTAKAAAVVESASATVAAVQDVPASRSVTVTAPGATVAEFTPRLSGRPESAPIYDSIRVVKAMPVVLGCVSMRSRCRCITEQGTDAGLTDDQCRAWLDNPPFNPYAEQPRPERAKGGDVQPPVVQAEIPPPVPG